MKTQTEPDPIIEELHAIRRDIAARFDNDVHRIAEDARRRQAASELVGGPDAALSVWVAEQQEELQSEDASG